MTEKEFADKYPIGTTVKYYPLIGRGAFKTAMIQSEPWELGHGEVVVKITGYAGGVSIEHIQEIR